MAKTQNEYADDRELWMAPGYMSDPTSMIKRFLDGKIPYTEGCVSILSIISYTLEFREVSSGPQPDALSN